MLRLMSWKTHAPVLKRLFIFLMLIITILGYSNCKKNEQQRLLQLPDSVRQEIQTKLRDEVMIYFGTHQANGVIYSKTRSLVHINPWVPTVDGDYLVIAEWIKVPPNHTSGLHKDEIKGATSFVFSQSFRLKACEESEVSKSK